MKPTACQIDCSGSGQVTYDEFHFTKDDLIRTARTLIAEKYGVNLTAVAVKVSADPKSVAALTLCVVHTVSS